MSDVVRIYLDLSNIVCGARDAAQHHGEDPWAMRLEARRLRAVLAGGRPVASATAALNGSVPEPARRRFAAEFSLIEVERGVVSGLDQAADEKLQNRMFSELVLPQQPGVVVLATGDGAGYSRRAGFTQPLIIARRLGFGVEVGSFRSSLNPVLGRLAEMDENALIDLDKHYRSITFLEGGLRFPDPISLRRRRFAIPHPWRPGELDWLTPGPGGSRRSEKPDPGEAGGGAA